MTNPWLQGTVQRNRSGSLLDASVIDNMKAFADASKMKRVALTVIAQHMGDEQLRELRNTFHELDSNQDGKLTIKEMQAGLKRAKVPLPGNLLRLFAAVDTNGS